MNLQADGRGHGGGPRVHGVMLCVIVWGRVDGVDARALPGRFPKRVFPAESKRARAAGSTAKRKMIILRARRLRRPTGPRSAAMRTVQSALL